MVNVGIFYPERDLDLRVNGSVDIENEKFDFDEGARRKSSDDIFAAEMAWRFREDWSVLAQYFDSSSTAEKTLLEDIEWEDVVFGEGSNASAGTHMEVTRLFVGKHLQTDPHHDLGFGLGIHWLNLGAFIEGTIIANGEPVSARRSVRTEGPLPNLGMWYRYSMSPRLAFRTRFDLFSASVGDYDGLLVNASAGINYRVTEHLGIGVAYNFFELDVKINDDGWRGNVDTIFNGLYVSLGGHY